MKNNNILIIGSGGREHALGWRLSQSPKVGNIYFAPGTAGTALIGKNTNISPLNFAELQTFAKEKKITLTVAGPDDILAAGIINDFREKGMKIFGPTKEATQIESSKAFAKQLMQEEGIPTATYQTFTDSKKAKTYSKKQTLPIVIKASGLALGKGVIIAQTHKEAETTIDDIMVKKIFGNAGDKVIIEEFLQGKEVSIHAFSDGETISLFPTARDHKPIFECNRGPNTGGMGTIAPLPDVTAKDLELIKNTIVLPAIRGLKKRGIPFTGCLYPGLMMTKDGPKVIEFNARFGDPEMESYMRLLETDLFDILVACTEQKLAKQKIKWAKKAACCIVLASAGYPASSHKGDIITGLEKAAKQKDIVVFHFATKEAGNDIVTNGGRVLGVTAIGKTHDEALDKAYSLIGPKSIHFEGMHYRKDIGRVGSEKIKAVIFDMDGLIVDSESIESKALEKLLTEYKKKPKYYTNGLIHIIGESGDASYQRFKDTYQLEDTIEVLRKKKRAIFKKLLKKKITPLPGFLPLITSLKKQEMQTALASNRFIEHIHLIVENIAAKHLFDVIVGPSETKKHKPHPDIFLQTAKKLGVNPNQCLVFEDSEIGVVAARAAGMKVIAVPHKYTKAHDFSKADKVVTSLKSVTIKLINSI